jgi:hypothetical protein
MGPDEYRRLHAACLDLAGKSSVLGVRLHWLTMAQGWIDLANEPPLGQPLVHSNIIPLKSRQDLVSNAGGPATFSLRTRTGS